MPLTEAGFNTQATRMMDHYRPGEPVDRFAGWLDELDTAFMLSATVTDATFAAAVTACIATRTQRGLPLVPELRMYADAEWHALKRDAKVLPAPPQEDDSSTPEERQRWAKENAAIREYANRYQPTPPNVLARLSDADRAAAEDFDRRNESVIAWPTLSPAARRAKERRIAAEKARVPELIAKARRETRARLDAITAERAATAHAKQAGASRTVVVDWKDGTRTVTAFGTEDAAAKAAKFVKGEA